MRLLSRSKKLHFATNVSMPSRTLGKTGVQLPILGFRTAAAGTRLNLRDAVRLYEDAFNLGVTYFDTASAFAGYEKPKSNLDISCRKQEGTYLSSRNILSRTAQRLSAYWSETLENYRQTMPTWYSCIALGTIRWTSHGF
jgi:predicted aldo/keto reductase-like oxidoreductase